MSNIDVYAPMQSIQGQLLQKNGLEATTNGNHKIFRGFIRGTLPYTAILVCGICRNTIGKHSYSCIAFYKEDNPNHLTISHFLIN